MHRPVRLWAHKTQSMVQVRTRVHICSALSLSHSLTKWCSHRRSCSRWSCFFPVVPAIDHCISCMVAKRRTNRPHAPESNGYPRLTHRSSMHTTPHCIVSTGTLPGCGCGVAPRRSRGESFLVSITGKIFEIMQRRRACACVVSPVLMPSCWLMFGSIRTLQCRSPVSVETTDTSHVNHFFSIYVSRSILRFFFFFFFFFLLAAVTQRRSSQLTGAPATVLVMGSRLPPRTTPSIAFLHGWQRTPPRQWDHHRGCRRPAHSPNHSGSPSSQASGTTKCILHWTGARHISIRSHHSLVPCAPTLPISRCAL